MLCCWLLLLFFVLFPKGGIRVGTIPLTWGYFLLAGIAPIAVTVRVLALRGPLRMPRGAWIGLAAMLPLTLCLLYGIEANGVLDPGGTAGMVFCIAGMPVVFLVGFGPYLRWVDGRVLSRVLRACVLLAAMWGLLLFVLHPITGKFLEIPYLTVNAADYGQIEATKNIARGFFFKLISTYNNGNLYGVATLILLPLFDYLERSRWKRGTVKLALLLTLSRSVWVGLLLNEMVPLLLQAARTVRTFPVVHVKRVRKQFAGVLLLLILVAVGAVLTTGGSGRVLAFLFDPSAGGRFAAGSGPLALSLLPSIPVVAFSEVVYRSALEILGVTGFLSFVLMMGSPLLAVASDRRYLQDDVRRAALQGLLLYAVVAAADGAFVLIPVMVFYWFAFAVLVYGWPGRQGLPALPGREVSPCREP